MTSSEEVVIIDGGVPENGDDATAEGGRERGSKKGRFSSDGTGGGTASLKGEDGGEFGEFSGGEVDGLYCPICFEAWSSGGDHHMCCLPCGHIYGLSCIRKWLARRGSSKCPQCKKNCRMKDIRLLYASRIVAIDGELQKTVQSLEAKCASLEKQGAEWSSKELKWKKKESDLHKQVQYLEARIRVLKVLLENEERRASASRSSASGSDARCSNKFTLQKDFLIEGARFFDVDSSSESYIFARRLLRMGGMHVLTKVSAESNNIVLTYNLPAAAWSCAWDVSDSHYVYTGLQNGTVSQFDMRHTARHVESLNGLTSNPVHSLYSLSPSSSRSFFTGNVQARNVLTAPYVIPESDKQGVCISLAYCKTSSDIVASYRPKIETPDGLTISQPTLTAAGQGTQGSHIYYGKFLSEYKKLGATCANVSDIRLPKSAIIDGVHNNNRAFASGDDSTGELVLHELPSLMAFGRLKPRNNHIRDVKYVRCSDSGVMSCLSEDTLQLYTAKLL
ncbi:RING/U-box superfamily protein [Striga asiatica]|uniref:RING-type E3 ubiquitin transferase n=1 Tax=Striga asiatica TaxID=4170 RepID=A0A5A7QKE0_STRAF|nr:RING/U-box superfamily protein [Striga asiatica]